tara:strand:+ start:511 stop:1203 length:693 start_codon:yes stop_codon:yes gene_type:complete
MSFKSWFVTDTEESAVAPTVEQTPINTTKFPTAATSQPSSFSFPTTPTPSPTYTPVGVSQEHLNNALEVYEKGFDSLNQSGYDFYEFFQAVMNAGVDNPQIYQMAFMMGAGMDKTITKDKLVEQSNFYIAEIGKVYDEYVAKGNAKKQETIDLKTNENQSLVGELDLMRQQMEALKTQIQDRETKLQAIDGKYGPKLQEIESKLAANDMAKNKVIQSIEQVKNGIVINLK